MFQENRFFSYCLALSLITLTCVACSPGGKLTADSKTDACKADISSALNAFKNEAGLNIQISTNDVASVVSTGEVSKSYGRDGLRMTSYFGLEASDGACNLKLYKQKKEGPGESSTTSGNYGAVKLTNCKCAK